MHHGTRVRPVLLHKVPVKFALFSVCFIFNCLYEHRCFETMADQQDIVDTTLKRPRHEPLEEQGAGAAGQEPVPRKKRQTLTNEEKVAVESASREAVQKIQKHENRRHKYSNKEH